MKQPRTKLNFPSDRKYLLVTHKNPDDDAISSVWLFLKNTKLTLRSPNIRVEFVCPGELYHGPIADDEEMHIFDTGGILQPNQGYWDHHFQNCKFHSATHAVHYHLFPKDRSYARLNIVAHVNRVDTGNKVNALTEEQWETVKTAQQIMRDEGGFARVVPNYRGPHYLSELITNFVAYDQENSDFEKLAFGIQILNAYEKKFEQDNRTEKLLQKAQVAFSDDICIVKLPKNDIDRKTLRNDMRDLRHSTRLDELGLPRADVYVTEYECDTQSPTRFGITIVPDAEKFDGMQALRDALYDADQSEMKRYMSKEKYIFLHHSNFVIYINNPSSTLTLQNVFDLTVEHLSRKQTASEEAA